MSLSINVNEDKVAELLRSSNSGHHYTVEGVQPVVQNSRLEKPHPEYPEVFRAVYTAPVLVTAETRERFMAVRRQIEESGVPLKSAEELTREIDKMRGRR